MRGGHNHIVPYKTFLIILAILITLTFISVFLTQVALGALTVAIALFIAAVKSSFVLLYFMHLKFEIRFFRLATLTVLGVIAAVIVVTLLDYITK